ncbi:MAG TPA: hypothetical protein VGP83_17115 [Pyrinomonadaceae bacterium]|jgi:hypothetical protein|nr:hypothetical protein [Pyrinomonadaceae bacterium]
MTDDIILARFEAIEDDLRTLHATFDGALVDMNDVTGKLNSVITGTLAGNERTEQFMDAMNVMLARITLILDSLKK